MFKFSVYLILLVSVLSNPIFAQDWCGTASPPPNQARNTLSDNIPLPPDQVVVIPVVVHVVYNTEAQNISDEQIQSQIDVLNEDFMRLHSNADDTWPQAASPNMKFELAKFDPDGLPTNGITRTYTYWPYFDVTNPETILLDQRKVKRTETGGKDNWDAQSYLNIWVCDLRGPRGYASFPDSVDWVQGMVVDHEAFGRGDEFSLVPGFNLGRTAIHEVGHYLRLTHIWGDGGCDIDDGIEDTPVASSPNYGCADSDGILCPLNTFGAEMYQNYMDYTDDDCMNLFTEGQVSLMRQAFSSRGSRVSILRSQALVPQDPCVGSIAVNLTINFDNNPEDTTWDIKNENGEIVASGGPYTGGVNYELNIPSEFANTEYTETICVPNECITFTLYDSFGDGFNNFSSSPPYTLQINDANSETIIGDNFTSSEIQSQFCIACNESTPLTTITASSNTINSENTSTILTASGGTDGTNALIYWYDGPNATGNYLGSLQSIKVFPKTTTTYYARRVGSCNSNLEDVSITIFNSTDLSCNTSNATAAFNNEPNDGFGNWTFTDTLSSGHFVGNSTSNGDGDANSDGDINSSGNAWGLFANSGQIAEMIRPFDNPLSPGDTFSIQMDNGWIDDGGSVGFSLRNTSGQNLLEFYFNGGQSSYILDNLNGAEATGIGFTDEGLQFDMTLTSANTLDITITELLNGTTHNFSKSLKNPSGGQTISFLRMFNSNAGGGSERNAYFNNLEVCSQPLTITPDVENLEDLTAQCEITPTAPTANNGLLTATADVTFPITTQGTSTITWTYDDGNGNTLTQTQNVLIEDTQGPEIICGSDIEVNSDLGTCFATLNIETPSVSDNCSEFGSSLDFDGINDKVIILNSNSLTFTTELTVEAWIYPRANKYSRIFSKYSGSGQNPGEFVFDTYDGSSPTSLANGRGLRLAFTGTNGGSVISPNVLALNSWNHVAGTFNNGTIKIYVNGVEVNSGTAGFTSIPSSSLNYGLGEETSIGTAQEFFNGQMDEFRLWNRALSSTEISNFYDKIRLASEPGLVAYYDFNDGTGSSIVTDKTGNGNNGSLSNMDPATDWTVSTAPVNAVFLTNNITGTADASGVYQAGETEITWTATDASGNSSSCTQLVTVNNRTVDFANIQSPPNGDICVSQSFTVFSQVYEAGLTDANNGVAPVIKVDFGFSATNGDPALWPESSWDNAIPNPGYDFSQNNDEYQYTITPSTTGEFYYSFRYSLDNGCTFRYGATNNGFWNGANNINGVLVVNEQPTWYADADNDSFGDINSTIQACNQPSGYVSNSTDCDDTNASINPGTSEIYFNGIDDDCDPDTIDENSGIFESFVVVNNQFFDLGASTGNPDFEGANLGSFSCNTGLNIDGGENKIFKCTFGNGDIINGKTFYRIYPQGSTPPAFSELSLGFKSNDSGAGQDCQNQTWQTLNANINLIANLTQSGTYVLEVYNSADYTFNTGSGTHLANNAGDNFKATFTYIEEPPVAVCNEDVTLFLDENGTASLTIAMFDGGSTDNCEIVSSTLSKTQFTCADLGNNEVTLTVSDAAGNQSSCSANVIIADNIPPTITCPDNITGIVATSAAGAVVNYTAPVGTDNCSATTSLVAGLASGATFPIGDTTVTYEVTDASNNTVECSFTVTVVGVAPVIVCPGTITVNNDAGNCSAVVNFDAKDVTGIPASVITYSQDPNTSFPVGTTSVSATATNAVGSSICTFDVVVIDNEIPVITTNGNQTVNSDAGECSAIVEVSASAADNCSVGQPEGTRDDGLALNAAYPVGTTTITWNVQDVNGNPATEVTQTIIVEDKEAPVAICQDITVELNENGIATITAEDINNGSTDNCEIASISIDKDSFDCEDLLGEAISKVVISQVYGGGGNSGATLTNDFIELFNSGNTPVDLNGWSVQYASSAGSSWAVTALTGTIQPGQYYLIQQAAGSGGTVALPTPDAVGTIAMAATNGKVLLANTTTAQSGTCPTGSQIIDFVGFGSANCFEGSGATTTLNNTTAAIRNNSCTDTDNNSADFSTATPNPRNSATTPEPCFSSGAAVSVTLTVTDIHGNTSTCIANVTVIDNIAPVITTNGDQSVDSDAGECGALVEVSADATDNCSVGQPVGTRDDGLALTDLYPVGTTAITWNVQDVNGNAATTVTQTVTVADNEVPAAICKDIVIDLDENGVATITAGDIDNGSTDNCEIDSIIASQTTFDCDDISTGDAPLSNDLFISEYIEGSGNNKAIEIYNGTGTPINLQAEGYNIKMFFNGSSSAGLTINLTGTIAEGDVFVLAQSSSSAAILAIADQTNGSGWYNGDDAVVLYKGNMPIDIIGQIGVDPGAAWTSGSISTADQTLVRNPNITDGNTDNAPGFPSLGTEWTSFPINTASNLGSHTVVGGGIPVTLTVTDIHGNSSICVANVTVVDVIPPVLAPEADQNVNLDAGCSITIPNLVDGSTATDNCTVSISQSPTAGTIVASSHNGTVEVTVTATDAAGNTDLATVTLTAKDITPPVLTPEADQDINLDDNCSITIPDLVDGSSATDNCTFEITQSPLAGTVVASSHNGTVEVTVTATDDAGNTDEAVVTLTAKDVTAPILTAEADQNVNLDANCSITIPDLVDGSSATDNCTFEITQSPLAGTVVTSSHNGTVEVTVTATDAAGNTDEAVVTLTAKDVTDPILTAEADQNINLDATCSITIPNLVDGSSADDNCTFEITQSPIAGTVVASSHNGTVEVTVTATDAAGNTDLATVTLTAKDVIAPTIDCPADITINCEDNTSSAALGVATGSDNCLDVTITESDVSTQVNDINDAGYYNYTITRTWTATDAAGNFTKCEQIITVQDVTDPIVDCVNITVILDEDGNASISEDDLDNGSVDDCSPVTLSINRTDFDCSAIGGDLDELIISEYVDGTGNNDWIEIYNGTGNEIVLGGVINGALVHNYSINIYKDGSTTPTSIGLLGTISDRGVYKFAHTDAPNASGVLSNFGSPAVVFDGNDAISLVNNITNSAVDIIGVIGENPGPNGWTSGGISTAGTTLVRKSNVQQGNISNFVASLPTEWIQFAQNDLSNLGSHDIQIINSANNVILTVTDVSGNVSECEANVFVVDNTPPVALCQDVTIQLDAFGNASVSPQAVDNGSNDACGIANLSLSQTAFSCDNVGANEVTLTVTDSNGNTATCTATVFVEDNVDPEVITKDITVQLDANGNASIQPSDINDGSNDACGIDTLSVFPNTFDCSNVGPNTVTLTVTDTNGNTAEADATVTVEDNVDPIAICKDITVQLDENGFSSIIGQDVDNGSSDACGIASYSVFPNEFGCDDIGENTVTLTVTDVNGNSSTCTSVVTVEGIIPEVTISSGELPEFCQGAVLVLTATTTQPDSQIRSFEWSGNGISDANNNSSVNVSGNGTYTVTVTSETNCVTTESFTVSGFDAGELISSYTILAFDDIFLHNSNLVETGAIGVTGTNGTVKLFQASTVVGFGQAANFNLNQGSSIGEQINQPANPTLPDFVSNTLSNNASPSVTIANGQSLTLNESVYNVVTVNQDATVTFNESNVYINELRTSDGANIEFAGCANVFINTKFRLAQNGVINSFGNNVVFFVNDDVQIEKGSDVRARIYSNGGEIFVKGANAKGNNAAEPTYMTGLFIANRVHGSINVIWNADDVCGPCEINTPSNRFPTASIPSNGSLLDFDVVAWPNPSNAIFNVRLKSIDMVNTAKIEVYDTSNKLVHSGTFRADEVYTFGDKLEGGVYIVQITQDKFSKTTRFVKY